jgi:hypothetical protein
MVKEGKEGGELKVLTEIVACFFGSLFKEKVLLCNPNTKGVEAGGSAVQGQPGLHSETLSQKIN